MFLGIGIFFISITSLFIGIKNNEIERVQEYRPPLAQSMFNNWEKRALYNKKAQRLAEKDAKELRESLRIVQENAIIEQIAKEERERKQRILNNCSLPANAMWREPLCLASAKHGVDVSLLYDIMDGEGPNNNCNTSYNADGGVHCGLFQFCWSTFASTPAGSGSSNCLPPGATSGESCPGDWRLDPYANADAAAWKIKYYGTGAWAASGW